MEEKKFLIGKFIISFLIAVILGFLIIHYYIDLAEEKGFFVKTYAVDDYTAKEDYNEKSIAFLVNHFMSTTMIYSPLSVESAYLYYADQNDIKLDNVFYVFGNGFQSFELSKLLVQDESIKAFTVGLNSISDNKADINAIPNEKLVIDEINAKFNTLSDGKIVFKATQNNVFDYNIYSLCVFDTVIDADAKQKEDKYIIKGKFDSFVSDDLSYVVVPLENNDYELILKKGIDLYYDKFIPLNTTKKDLTIILPKLTLESVDNPAKYYVNTKLHEDFETDKKLTNLTSICHLNISCNESDLEVDNLDNSIDFSKSCVFAVRNKVTRQIIIVGNVL